MDDLKLIKKYYGEKMSHLVRDLFPTILEENGKLYSFLNNHFAHNRYLYDDIVNNNLENSFKEYVYNALFKKNTNKDVYKMPKELLNEVGYQLYKCSSEEDIQKFRKYYKEGEELCTFRGGRLNTCHVYFAVKEDIDKIKRENFIHPDRQDTYGTSIISIQFSRTNHYLSIKNRYNHIVKNPDATFNNNLDNIVPGLTKAFEKYYHYSICSNQGEFEIPGYVWATDGKYYKYNYEIDGIYYCINNIIVDYGKVIDKYQDKSRYIFMDQFIMDTKEKIIFSYTKTDDSFLNYYNKFNLVDIQKTNDGRNLYFSLDDRIMEIRIDNLSRMTYFRDDTISDIDSMFLYHNQTMETFVAPNLKKIGNYFMQHNTSLKQLYLPNISIILNKFLMKNENMEYLYLPNLKFIGDSFMNSNIKMNFFMAPKLEEIGEKFLISNTNLQYLCLDSLKQIDEKFMTNNKLEYFIAPNLLNLGISNFYNNNTLEYLEVNKNCQINPFSFNNHKYYASIIKSIKEKGIWDIKTNEKVLQKVK